MSESYAKDGVDVSVGDSFSAYAGELCRTTYKSSPFVEITDFSNGHFRGPRGFRLKNLPDGYWLDVAPDGVGTKSVIHVMGLTEHCAARDVLAMTCGDISRWGGMPLLFSNVLETSSLGKTGDQLNGRFRETLRGLALATKKQGIVMYKGETAEMGSCVGSDDPNEPMKFNWSGFALGVYHHDKLITGDSLEPGQRVIALRENGFRSNGLSSVRTAFKIKFGEEWWNNSAAKESIRAAAEPSILYDRFLAELNGWLDPDFKSYIRLHAIIHLTGGGIKSKFAEDILFPRGLSATLDQLWEPPSIMRDCAQWRGMDSKECYGVWNGGQGMLLVANEADVGQIIARAKLHGIDARDCGEVTREVEPVVRITSQFDERIFFSYP